MKCVIRVWCEWDFDQDDQVFANETLAREWVERVVMPEMEDGDTLEELEDQGLVSFETIEVIGG